MPLETAAAMAAYMAASSFTPGPGNLLALNTMLTHGWRGGRRLLAGIAAGYLTVQTLCTLAVYGLSVYLTPALAAVKYAGAAYLVWLAVRIMRGASSDAAEQARPPAFSTGFLMQLVNVKIYFYITTLLTGYLVPWFPQLWQLALLGLLVVLVGCAAGLTWAFFGLRLRAFYTRHQRAAELLLGACLLLCAVNILR